MRREERTIANRLGIGVAAWLLSAAIAIEALAAPVDLRDATPRAVDVAFEISPHDAPERLDSTYTPFLSAWLEPGPERGQVSIRVPGHLIEEHVLARPEPVPGTFSDFVWIFDAESGEVLSASVEGQVKTLVDFGLSKHEASARIAAQMTTLGNAGYRDPTRFLGEVIFRTCDPSASRRWSRCNEVASQRYDRTRGYVNAVGELAVETSVGMRLRTFSPLGEARFAERKETQQPRSLRAQPASQAARGEIAELVPAVSAR